MGSPEAGAGQGASQFEVGRDAEDDERGGVSEGEGNEETEEREAVDGDETEVQDKGADVQPEV